MDSILSKYLKDGSLESQGQFTISPLKALEKFGRHAFPRKTAWLTKMLQAVATGSPSPKMSVVLGPKSVRLNLAGGWQGGADAASLMSEGLNLKEKGFGDPLVDALRYVASAGPASLDLLSVQSGTAKISRLTRESVENFQMEWPEKGTFLEIQISGEVDLGSKAEMGEELSQASGFLGFPVTLNGKAMQGSLLRKGRSGYVPGPGGFRLSHLGISALAEQRAVSGHVLKSRNEMNEADLCYRFLPSMNSGVVLNWAVDGVILKRQRAPMAGRGELQLLLPFETDNADLSGFDFTASPKTNHLLDRCTPLVTNLIVSGGGTSPGASGPNLSGFLRKHKSVFSPLFSILWGLNYVVLFVAFMVFLVVVSDFSNHGLRRTVGMLGVLGVLLSPTVIISLLQGMLIGPEAENVYPSAIVQPPPEQVNAVPLSQLDWR